MRYGETPIPQVFLHYLGKTRISLNQSEEGIRASMEELIEISGLNQQFKEEPMCRRKEGKSRLILSGIEERMLRTE